MLRWTSSLTSHFMYSAAASGAWLVLNSTSDEPAAPEWQGFSARSF